MAGWTRKRVGGVIACAAVVAAAWAVFALAAPAQTGEEPGKLPAIPSTPVSPLGPESGDRGFPRLVLPGDDEIQPAQFTTPGGTAPGATAPTRAVADPPSPVVRIQVRVPADNPPGDEIKYIITVQNVSSADAHRVTVRNPLSKSVTFVKADPETDKKLSTAEQLMWSFGTLAPGKSKTIELILKPTPDAGDVKNLAYVSFEHGEAVTTRINKPVVKVTKSAPKQAVRDEPYSVRVVVENTGKVAAADLRVVENVPATAEVEPVTKGARRTDRRDAPPGTEGQQWVWEIAKLMPGERRVFEYRVTAREAKDLYALTNLSAAKGIQDKAEARTLVLVPGLTVKITGPAANAPVNPGESARYEITVRNSGTLPSSNVRVTGTLPADCKPTMKTEGGQLTRDAIQWTVPRLEPGEAQTFRFAVKANTTGRRVVVASAADARGQRAADELATLFQGTAALVWESTPNPAALAVGRQGTFTVKVRNNGGEPARNVHLEVELPEAVSLVQVTPNVRPAGTKLVFGPEVVPAYGQADYTVTFEAKQPAQAWFKLKLAADCLGDRPMQTEKHVEITGGR